MIRLLSLFSGIGAFEKASKVNSDTQLYKQAGNSIVVNVLARLFDEIWKTGIFDDWGDDL